MTECGWCRRRGQTWDGSAPKCAFPDGGKFVSDNWNCATMNVLRALIDTGSEVWSDDQWLGTLAVGGKFLVLSWYKRRGRTEGAWLVDAGEIRPISLADAECAIAEASS